MQLQCGDFSLDLRRPQVMGVLNVTPDSFADGGQYVNVDAAYARAVQIVEEGATIIDIGGESTRPGAQPVSVQEELARVLPVVERCAQARLGALLSVDTSKPEVMEQAVAAGAAMINDVRALQAPGALAMAARLPAAVCLMHMQGAPRTMQHTPSYADVVREVAEFLQARADVCLRAGLSRERLLLDPGFGFGKTVEHNLSLLKHLDQICALGYPVLMGLSRKSTIGAVLDQPVEQRLSGSVAGAVLAVWQGAAVVRVHDVKATVDALKMVAAVRAAP